MVSLIFALKILVEEMIVLVLDKVVVEVIVSSKSFKLAPASEAVGVVVEAETVWRLFGIVVIVVESKGGKLVIELVGASRMFLVMD